MSVISLWRLIYTGSGTVEILNSAVPRLPCFIEDVLGSPHSSSLNLYRDVNSKLCIGWSIVHIFLCVITRLSLFVMRRVLVWSTILYRYVPGPICFFGVMWETHLR